VVLRDPGKRKTLSAPKALNLCVLVTQTAGVKLQQVGSFLGFGSSLLNKSTMLSTTSEVCLLQPGLDAHKGNE
jgi:hypothetical protein